MFKTSTILVLILLFLVLKTYAQKSEKEAKQRAGSYERYKKSAPAQQDTDDLLKKAGELKDDKPEQALDNVQEALGRSIAQNDPFNEARSYMLLGQINENIQEWKLAQENYMLAYEKLSGSYQHTDEYKKTLQGLGNTNLKLGNYDLAIKYYEEILALPELSNKRKVVSDDKNLTKLDISEVYYQQGQYDRAMNTLQTIDVDKKIADRAFQTRFQNQQAKIYAKTNDLSKTRELYSNSVNSIPAGSAAPQEAKSLEDTKEEIAGVLRSQQRYDEEIELRNQSVEFNTKANNFSAVTNDKVEIGKTLAAKGENLAALKQIEEASRIADTLNNNPKQQAIAYLALADLYEKNGRVADALSVYRKYSRAVARADTFEQHQLLEKSNLIKKQRDIEEVSKDVSIGQREETIARATVARQQLIIYGLLFIILIVVVTSYFIYKNAVASKTANQLLALKSLRSQMNPHFIFNALNSVNHFIAQQDERTANKFLSEFSQLMRLVMENSQEDFIPLQKEHEILSLYLKLEHYRFRDKFDYEIEMDNSINTENIEVPPMLIQPYIENAVWHGLRYKNEKGKLKLRFQKASGNLVVEILDDGIGRKRSAELKTANQRKHNSTGLKNIQERLQIINKVYKANYRVMIEDLQENSGTLVRIYLPTHNRMNRV
jgi:tetratricopeptide (TPR) repeat protein